MIIAYGESANHCYTIYFRGCFLDFFSVYDRTSSELWEHSCCTFHSGSQWDFSSFLAVFKIQALEVATQCNDNVNFAQDLHLTFVGLILIMAHREIINEKC